MKEKIRETKMSYRDRGYTEEQMIEEFDLMYIWTCPNCKYTYEDYPGYNEALDCPICGTRCVQSGESYSA